MVPKRAFWAATGYAAGFGTSIWAVRKVKSVVQRFTPSEVLTRTAATAGATKRRIGDALSEGREVMHSREAQMRADLENRGARPEIRADAVADDQPVATRERANLRLVDETGGPLELESESAANRGNHISKRASMRVRRPVR